MKVSSPFIEFIPDCKKSMRRLRKKIYKFITSKTYHKKQPNHGADLLAFFREREVPSFLLDVLAKKKTVDINSIKNMNVLNRIPLKDIVAIAQKQQQSVFQSHAKWISVKRNQAKASRCLEELRQKEYLSKRTLSSTEFQYQEQYDESSPSNVFNQQYPDFQIEDINQSLNQDLQFHHFERGNSFLQIESSILSQENLFKFQQ